jgi:hypothetical protein
MPTQGWKNEGSLKVIPLDVVARRGMAYSYWNCQNFWGCPQAVSSCIPVLDTYTYPTIYFRLPQRHQGEQRRLGRLQSPITQWGVRCVQFTAMYLQVVLLRVLRLVPASTVLVPKTFENVRVSSYFRQIIDSFTYIYTYIDYPCPHQQRSQKWRSVLTGGTLLDRIGTVYG